jgi:hypothetical protein
MSIFVVGYFEVNSDRNVNYPVGVYDDKALAEAAADREWIRLKADNDEIFDGFEDEDIAEADEQRDFSGIAEERIAVKVDTVDNMAELKGYFIGKCWLGSWWNTLAINKEIG